ncbi:hypothetical protein VNO77_25230 [Canavalia gladiata]|uniref:Uncharacterized protein n=1 Tax=Canavalia gladiata TaxID=3824 RepID=A0AAN9L8C3_CANGL
MGWLLKNVALRSSVENWVLNSQLCSLFTYVMDCYTTKRSEDKSENKALGTSAKMKLPILGLAWSKIRADQSSICSVFGQNFSTTIGFPNRVLELLELLN